VSRRNDPDQNVGIALGLAVSPDQRATDRRLQLRRRGDATSVADVISAKREDDAIKSFALGSSRQRKSALYSCGCVIVDPPTAEGHLQLLECPTHAALQAKLRRRQTDRH
jgi:hypothetical protein